MKTKAQMNWEIGKEAQKEIIKYFNDFLKKWTGDSYPHLIDSDDNDGEDFRQKLQDLFYQIRQTEYRRAKEDAIKEINKEFIDWLEGLENQTEDGLENKDEKFVTALAYNVWILGKISDKIKQLRGIK